MTNREHNNAIEIIMNLRESHRERIKNNDEELLSEIENCDPQIRWAYTCALEDVMEGMAESEAKEKYGRAWSLMRGCHEYMNASTSICNSYPFYMECFRNNDMILLTDIESSAPELRWAYHNALEDALMEKKQAMTESVFHEEYDRALSLYHMICKETGNKSRHDMDYRYAEIVSEDFDDIFNIKL